ncbi:S1C family serine protease [Bryobacter aggregatus]|uniref:S1C family serine protease n=1 Tax=Bryobacter aggregatus TaxID=360054 RepID=UPI00068A8941|nr:trypsin-like peptidase domain-containing protein [Bryobacter aggregatus]
MSGPGFGEIAEQLRRSTVQVRVDGGRAGSGSGVVWSADGKLISNAHVVTRDRVEVEFWDGEVMPARLLRRDGYRDLVLLAVERTAMPVPAWADSSLLREGEEVLAVGNPLGFVGALSTGVVHGLGPLQGLGEKHWVQANIRLAPGNSGGALANSTGAVVGINTMVAGPLGLAVPSNEVAAFVKRAGQPDEPLLGVTVETVPLRVGARRAVGLRIQQVAPNGRADVASLRPGDVIIGMDGQIFSSLDEWSVRLLKGGLVHLEFLRNGKAVPREVVIALSPGAEGRIAAAA